MSKPRTRSATVSAATTLVKELKERLEDETKASDQDTALRAQVEFWNRLRPILAANDASEGLEALDNLALAVLADDDSLPALLERSVFLLPHPDSMIRGEVPAHGLFKYKASPTHGKRPGARSGKAVGPAKKKQRATRKAPSLLKNLPAHTPAKIRADLEELEQKAADSRVALVRLAYRWNGQRVWYDPIKQPDLCLAHYRLVMQFRSVFLDCALYAPTTKAGERRKQKLKAIIARFRFLSWNIEIFGYYGFLRLIEKGAHDNLMWPGGKAAKHSVSAKAAKANQDEDDVPAQEDLAVVLRTNPSRYKVILGRITDPSRIDEDGYASIPELLEQTHALDPSRPEHLRLSDRALARVVLDVQKEDPPYPSWVGNTSRGDWKKLLASEELHKTLDEVEQLLANDEPVAAFTHKPYQETEKGDDDSDYESNGHPTVRPPSRRNQAGGPHYKPQPRKDVCTGLSDSEASEEEASEEEHSDDGSDHTPDENDDEGSGNDQADADADPDVTKSDASASPDPKTSSKTSGSSKSTNPGNDKPSGKSTSKSND